MLLFKKEVTNQKILNRKQKEESWFPSFKLLINGMVMEIATNDMYAHKYIARNYVAFMTNAIEPYYKIYVVANNYRRKPIKEIITEDDEYFYGKKQFIEFFHYKHAKNSNTVHVILPLTYKDEAFDNFFRMLLSSKAINFNMLLLHGSAVVRDGKIILFIGQSGAGKSTIAGLSGLKMFHDDIFTLTHLGNGRVRLNTIPFKPEFQNYSYEGDLECIYRIYQSTENYLEPISEQEKLMLFIYCIWSFDVFNHEQTKAQNDKIMAYASELVKAVPMKKLHFTKSNDFLKLI